MTTLEKYIHVVEMQHKADLCKEALIESIYANPKGNGEERNFDCEPLYQAIRAVSAYQTTKKMWMKVPRAKREKAQMHYNDAIQYVDRIGKAAGSFSGKVTLDIGFGEYTAAESVTCRGDRYSSQFYHMTDVIHTVRVTPKGYLSIADIPKQSVRVFPLEYNAATKACKYAILNRGKLKLCEGYLAYTPCYLKVADTYEKAMDRLSAHCEGVEEV